ncbi:ubiquinol-cytochrome-c reductase complex assembly factor 1 [Drosophila pseudoobscura]|uniref:Ubiquinol-cytochrome-c reductase complex assembly factor 1 n=1 Tax=Drosophila pseudoobscura pseudoobscura TaxID=46245 RepID=Q29F39_DROPS|nr:ubiquinol-cytochrome-c reductase complex assembly factor 1 [Drosophila pseudoobscura]
MQCTRAVARLATGISKIHLVGQPFKQTAGCSVVYSQSCRLCSSARVMDSADKTKPTTPEPPADHGILKRVMNKVGFTPNTKARLKVTSHLLYESVADKINYVAFFRDFSLPNTFNSWFLVTELHVWLLLMRSMAEGSETGEDGRFLRNCIVEAMWGDVNTRAKKLGAHNPSRTRQQIETLSEQFQAALIAYDEGIMSDDRVLAGALWRRFFEMNCDDYAQIERLVKYVRQQAVMLDSLPREQFITKPKVAWLDLDKCKV